MRFDQFVKINPIVELEKGREYPYVGMAEVMPGRRYVYAEEERIYEGGGTKFSDGDILFARITPSLEHGKIAQYKSKTHTKEGMGSTEFFVFRDREGMSDLGYVYYLSLTDTIRKPAELSMTGASGRQRADLDAVRNVEIAPPPLPIQRKIAAILSAYDDLIENNTRRIAILEEMAQLLYREWFVHFRFPGHEDVEMVDSELGAIPEGWEVVAFTDVADVLTGSTPRTKVEEYWSGSIPFFSPRDITTPVYVLETERTITELGLENCSSDLYPKNTVFITARGTVGRVIMPAVPMAMNQTCYALRGQDGISQYYVFLGIKNQVERLRQRAHGAVFDTIIIDTFQRLQVVKPPRELVNLFHTQVAPIFEQILNLLSRNVILRQTRDLLLPRLISGELDVADLPIDVAQIALDES